MINQLCRGMIPIKSGMVRGLQGAGNDYFSLETKGYSLE